MSSLEHLSIKELKKMVANKNFQKCPPYSKWSKQQLIDHLNGVGSDSSTVKFNKRPTNLEAVADDFMNKYGHLNKQRNNSQEPSGWSPVKSDPSNFDDITFTKKKTKKKKRSKPPSDWSPVKSEPGFFENIVDQFGNFLSPPKEKKRTKAKRTTTEKVKRTKRKSHSFHSSSSRNYKKSYKNLIRLTKPQLQRMAKYKGLNTSGQKAEIARRISHGTNSSVQGNNTSLVNLKKTKKQLLRLSKKELQRLAAKKNVNGIGAKIDIINRIKGDEPMSIGSSSIHMSSS